MSDWNSEVEIYLKDAEPEAIVAWLGESFPGIERQPPRGQTLCLVVAEGAQRCEVRVVPRAAGKHFTCVWFKQRPARWASDVDAARAAFAATGCEVRCVGEGWKEGDDPDLWWRINARGEGAIVWAE